eukprot:scaffold43195_cov35-Cyclotella_meneghiniana.AAC.1
MSGNCIRVSHQTKRMAISRMVHVRYKRGHFRVAEFRIPVKAYPLRRRGGGGAGSGGFVRSTKTQ